MPTPSTRLERGISIVFVGVVVLASIVGPWWVAPVGFIALGVAYGFPDREDLTFFLVLGACIALAMVLAVGLIVLVGS